MAVTIIPRWNLDLGNINNYLDKLLLDVIIPTNQRGRPYKRKPTNYIKLLVLKEFYTCSLRKAEYLLTEHIDHSTIHFWEKKLSVEFIENLVKQLAKKIKIPYDFSFIDSTKFSTWNNNVVEIHTLVRIANGTLYPVSIYFGSVSPSKAVANTLIGGRGNLLADRWYDDNKSFKIIMRKGYTPIIKAHKRRDSGYWRKRARKVYDNKVYRQRGRGESLYGSLTNEFGDRLKTILQETTVTRIGFRFIVYLVKIFMRQSVCFVMLVIY